MSNLSLDRRRFLFLTGTASVVSTSGCSGLTGNRNGKDGYVSETKTDTLTPTEVPEKWFLDGTNEVIIEWSKELENGIREDHFSQFQVVSSEGREADGFALFEKNGEGEGTKIFETEGGQAKDVSPIEFSVKENELYAEIQKKDRTFTSVNNHVFTKNSPKRFLVDVKNAGRDTNWSSPYRFDNHTFSQEGINEWRKKWNQEAVLAVKDDSPYDSFLDKVKADADFTPKYKKVLFPNHEKDNDKFSRGHFELDLFKKGPEDKYYEEETIDEVFKTTLQWATGAAKMQHTFVHNGAPSGYANRMAASAELIIDDVHPDAETRGWGVYNPMLERGGTHGTMMFYDEKWGTGWWHVDTTSNNIVKPEKAQKRREDVWSPFRSKDVETPGFHPGPVQDGIPSNLSYRDKSSTGMFGLAGMVLSGRPEEHNPNKLFITDQWLDEAYEHIRDDGDISPILDPIEEMVHSQVETGEHVGIFGEDLDNTYLVAGDLDDLYNEVMTHPEIVSEDAIFQYLETD